MSFTYVLHARPLRICIRIPSSAPIDRSPGGFWDSAAAKQYPTKPDLIRLAICRHCKHLGCYKLTKADGMPSRLKDVHS